MSSDTASDSTPAVQCLLLTHPAGNLQAAALQPSAAQSSEGESSSAACGSCLLMLSLAGHTFVCHNVDLLMCVCLLSSCIHTTL